MAFLLVTDKLQRSQSSKPRWCCITESQAEQKPSVEQPAAGCRSPAVAEPDSSVQQSANRPDWSHFSPDHCTTAAAAISAEPHPADRLDDHPDHEGTSPATNGMHLSLINLSPLSNNIVANIAVPPFPLTSLQPLAEFSN